MAKKSKSLLCLIIMFCMLILSGYGVAETQTIQPDETYKTSYNLNAGDTITWDWSSNQTLNFYIMNINEIKAVVEHGIVSDSGSYEVPHGGEWIVCWQNVRPWPYTTYPVVLDYNIETSSPEPEPEPQPDPDPEESIEQPDEEIDETIAAVLCLTSGGIFVVAIIGLYMQRKKKKQQKRR